MCDGFIYFHPASPTTGWGLEDSYSKNTPRQSSTTPASLREEAKVFTLTTGPAQSVTSPAFTYSPSPPCSLSYSYVGCLHILQNIRCDRASGLLHRLFLLLRECSSLATRMMPFLKSLFKCHLVSKALPDFPISILTCSSPPFQTLYLLFSLVLLYTLLFVWVFFLICLSHWTIKMAGVPYILFLCLSLISGA